MHKLVDFMGLIFTKLRLLFPLVLIVSACGARQEADTGHRFRALIEEAEVFMQDSDSDAAMKKAVEALELAEEHLMDECRAEAMNVISAIDISASRDSQAWDYAVETESLCREKGFTKDLARALISKARICSFANISKDENRDDEAIPYLEEALRLSEIIRDVPLQVDAYYILSQIYVNKNRWNDVLDRTIYNQAEDYLSRGEVLARSHNLSDLQFKGLLYRIRLLRQVSRLEDAVGCCLEALAASSEDDYLSRYQIYDQLTSLYHSLGDFDKANESHWYTLDYVRKYMTQKADRQLQATEMEYGAAIRQQTAKKNRYLVTSLCLALFILVSLIVILANHARRTAEKNVELEHREKTKDELISFLSNDLDLNDLEKEKASLNEAVATYVENVIENKNIRTKELGLTRRELEILRLSSMGKSAADIASELNISLRTVNNHKYNIFSKMGVGSTMEMTAKAHRLKII